MARLKALFGLSLMCIMPWASAGLITVTFGDDDGESGNDCAGQFGGSFENCAVNGSPIIAKFEFEEDGSLTDPDPGDDPNPQINADFTSVTGAEFSFGGTDETSGTWSYAPEGDDPGVRYWVAKGGPRFNLFFMVDAAFDGVCAEEPLSDDCMDQALVQEEGSWSTPSQNGLSHLSFYDTERSVPEPAPLALLGLGLLGLGVTRLKRAR